MRIVTFIVGVVLGALVLPPAYAAVKQAVNADKVDGIHAVRASASRDARSGKLVATDRRGVLPDGIVGNADSVDDLDGSDLRTLTLSSTELGGSRPGQGGFQWQDNSGDSVRVEFPLPSSYTGAPITVKLPYVVAGGAGCNVSFSSTGRMSVLRTNDYLEATWLFSENNQPSVTMPADAYGELQLTTLGATDGTELRPGDLVYLAVVREVAGDTCTATLEAKGMRISW